MLVPGRCYDTRWVLAEEDEPVVFWVELEPLVIPEVAEQPSFFSPTRRVPAPRPQPVSPRLSMLLCDEEFDDSWLCPSTSNIGPSRQVPPPEKPIDLEELRRHPAAALAHPVLTATPKNNPWVIRMSPEDVLGMEDLERRWAVVRGFMDRLQAMEESPEEEVGQVVFEDGFKLFTRPLDEDDVEILRDVRLPGGEDYHRRREAYNKSPLGHRSNESEGLMDFDAYLVRKGKSKKVDHCCEVGSDVLVCSVEHCCLHVRVEDWELHQETHQRELHAHILAEEFPAQTFDDVRDRFIAGVDLYEEEIELDASVAVEGREQEIGADQRLFPQGVVEEGPVAAPLRRSARLASIAAQKAQDLVQSLVGHKTGQKKSSKRGTQLKCSH